ncbi:outer membrane beta-barrel protein [Pseudoxanthomonas sp. GM95]|uniref:outer membrane beta-barrel protein n=1 Tax=Pseudoxanthomonas sp. GM95 TaxID=1881043 RepID=UPI000B8949ED|nr:outer membrane beta-barrel protein [Pseudoxanthomonas sp. GM95]
MKKTATLLLACTALGLASQAAAQSISPAWDAYRKQQKERQQQAGNVPALPPMAPVPTKPREGYATPLPPTADGTAQVAAAAPQPASVTALPPPAPATPVAQQASVAPAPPPPPSRPRKEKPRIDSGAFVGVQGGKGWVYEDIDQSMWGLNGGYRWRAGAVTLIGIEAAAGKLDRVSDHDGFYAPKVDFYSLGGTARFNFGRNSPWFAVARLGYWSGETDIEREACCRSFGGYNYSYYESSRERVYGAYAGFGIGVDLGRHASLNLNYTGYVYSNSYYDEDYEVNYADTVSFGVEVRF